MTTALLTDLYKKTRNCTSKPPHSAILIHCISVRTALLSTRRRHGHFQPPRATALCMRASSGCIFQNPRDVPTRDLEAVLLLFLPARHKDSISLAWWNSRVTPVFIWVYDETGIGECCLTCPGMPPQSPSSSPEQKRRPEEKTVCKDTEEDRTEALRNQRY